MANAENHRYIVQVFVGALSAQYEALSVEASKQTNSEEIVSCITDKLNLRDGAGGPYELAEVVGDVVSGECKERRLGAAESPVAVMLLWPNNGSGQYYRFYLREKIPDEPWMENFSVDPQLIKDYFQRFLYQPKDREYPDLCQLPELNEQTLLDNLRARFAAGYIYTYVGSILIALNPFKFYPIYNPKYVKLYQNKRIGSSLPPHIFAVADAAYHCMVRERNNQCIVISGESGSGKTESTNFLLHHLTALSQKGSHGSGVEQTILSAGPVLEAFGNAKTAHNNNSSRFGKFIQVNYKENGMVHGAVVQKYLLEKSRICSQGRNERNYHVFYYLLAGASPSEREQLHLLSVDKYNYLCGSGVGGGVGGVDEQYEFSRLKQSMEMVGFTMDKQRRLFAVLSAVLLLGNVEFQPQRKSYHHDEAVGVRNPEVVALISDLLRVRKETLLQALTAKRARASGETLVINYRLPEAVATRDAMAKCLYGALFDWIVLQVNHALLSDKDCARAHRGHSIGVLDIFGFEDFGPCNSFEQLCINYANEHLQHYFNQHVFKCEQDRYRRERIRWQDIGFSDNTACLQLIEGKPQGLLCVLDDQCNFPWATNETLLQKYNSVHADNPFYEKPPRREPAFTVRHYAGKVKYQVTLMREKNLDLMRADIVSVLKNSSLAFVRELVGVDPVAVFRWAILRAFFRGYFAFMECGRRHRATRGDGARAVRGGARGAGAAARATVAGAADVASQLATVSAINLAINRIAKNKSFRPRERAAKGLKNLQSVKTLAGRCGGGGGAGGGQGGQGGGKRKQPLTVAAQFQHSLAALMETLNQANPFFIRCIKSNGDKVPNVFDEETVQRQLRYTGMLETVRIRQAGYNVRLTYDEFIQLYRILLPKGLLSSQQDVRHFLHTLNLDRDNYQLGTTKIFMRESEQTKLEYRLHQQIMASIITIQRWFRAVLERRRYVALRAAAITLQRSVRSWLALRHQAASALQAWWRAARTRRWYCALRAATVAFQGRARGHLLRARQLDGNGRTTRPPSIDQLRTIIDIQLNLLMAEEAEKTRQLRATQSLPLDSSAEVCRSPLPLESCSSVYRRRGGRGAGAGEGAGGDAARSPHNNIGTIECSPDDDGTIGATGAIGGTGTIGTTGATGTIPLSSRITPSSLASELLWLRIDHNYLHNDHNHKILAERELAESLASSSEEYLRQAAASASASAHADRTRNRRSPPPYHRSVSGGAGAGAGVPPAAPPPPSPPSPPSPPPPADSPRAAHSLQSLPPVRRDPRAQYQHHHVNNSCTSVVECGSPAAPPAPPARSARRSPRRLDRTDRADRADRTDRTDSAVSHATNHDHETKRAGVPPPPAPSPPPPAESLRRRNSDPAPAPRQDPRHKDYIGQVDNGLFRIAGHRFRKGTRFGKGDVCAYCRAAVDAFVTQGQRCIDCKQLYHTKCVQNKGVITQPCESPGPKARPHQLRPKARPHRAKAGRKQREPSPPPPPPPPDGHFSLTGTSQFTDRTDKIISDATELQAMQHFIARKICQMEALENDNKQSEVDRVFKHALREFKDNLVATYSVVETRGSALKYKDLISNFVHVMRAVCAREGATLSITVGVNAFRGFMDEFMTSHVPDKARTKRKKDKKRKADEPLSHLGHTFVLSMINIPTECELCKTFFMWPIERSLICQQCRLASHKKCYLKVSWWCAGSCSPRRAAVVGVVDALGRSRPSASVVGAVDALDALGRTRPAAPRVFGAPLASLPQVGGVPLVVDRLLTTIEMTGLYTEGLYRKSGLSSKVRELRRQLDECGAAALELLDTYAVHVRASVLKGLLRELPEPLLTADLYDDFVLAAHITDPMERVSSIYTILKKLPQPNFDLVERLIFHLARVALNEEHNRMGPNALAIVFAPCILRSGQAVPAQESLADIAAQTACLEAVLHDKMAAVRAALQDIATLDSAVHSLRCLSRRDLADLRREKQQLTAHLPALCRATSHDELRDDTDHDPHGSEDDLSGPPPPPAPAQGGDDPIMV